MIKVKHFMEAVEPDDGARVWVEPIGLTRDLTEWCSVDEVLPQIAPPRDLWDWFIAHPEQYDQFAGRYHTWLSQSPHLVALCQLAHGAIRGNFTLLHGGDEDQNSATALMQFLTELLTHHPKAA